MALGFPGLAQGAPALQYQVNMSKTTHCNRTLAREVIMNKHNELQLYLASGSPRRHELLTQLGYRFEVLKLDVPEQREEGEKPQDYVCRLARDKATAGVAAAPTALPVLGADTIVVLGSGYWRNRPTCSTPRTCWRRSPARCIR